MTVMEEKEKQLLYNRILSCTTDPKGARIAAKMFINKASCEEAVKFLDYLDSSDLVMRKMARYILGQMGCPQAMPFLLEQLKQTVSGLTFLPDEEYKESHFFVNLIEILESLYGIVRKNTVKDETLRHFLLDVFKKTKHEDLRFSLIKLIAQLGESAEYFLSIYEDLTNKEKRALYHVYSFVESERRMDLYHLGIKDAVNQEFVVPNLMEFNQGRKLLIEQIPNMSDKQKVSFLTVLLENDSLEFLEPLITLLDNENRQVIQLAVDNIKTIDFNPFPLQRFLEKIKTGYSFEMIKASLTIFEHFVGEKIEEHLLEAMITQPLYNNKAIILDSLLKSMKGRHNIDPEFSKQILKVLLEYFKVYVEERVDFLVTILKVLPSLTFTQSLQIRSVKKELLLFLKHHEKQINQTLMNNIQECIGRLNQHIARFEEAEEKIKHIDVLFDLDLQAIEAQRLEKVKTQLGELNEITAEFSERFVVFLVKLLEEAAEWKVRSIAAELLGDYGTPESLMLLAQKQHQDQSLGVRVAAGKAAERIQQRFAIAPASSLVIEPLFYVSKLIGDTLKELSYSVEQVKEWPAADFWKDRSWTLIWVADQFLDEEHPERLEQLKNMLEHNTGRVVIITAHPEKLSRHRSTGGIKLLKKPFAREDLCRYLEGIK